MSEEESTTSIPETTVAETTASLFGTEDSYYSQGIVVMKRGSREIVFSKNPDQKLEPASLVKMMTSLVAIEQIPDLNAVTAVDTDIYLAMVEANASMAGFYGNESVTFADLLYGTLLPSGGEAAGTLSLRINEMTGEDIVSLMNAKARSIGLNNSSFANESGLSDPGNYSTAKDMAILLDQALQNENFRKIFTSPVYTSGVTLDHPEGVTMYSTVLSYIDPEATEAEGFKILGGKSGTELSGQNWATLGSKNGEEYIIVVMGAPLGDLDEPNNFQIEDTLNLYRQIQ